MAELWQQAARWLRNLGALPDSCSALNEQARLYDLALALQDGTVLCIALNKLQANSVKVVHPKPSKQFMKMQNINAFLAELPAFGIKPDDLFTADELYYASNFGQVLHCLSQLSKSQLAGLAGHKFFGPADEPATAAASAATKAKSSKLRAGVPAGPSSSSSKASKEEDAYGTLEGLMGQAMSLQEAASDLADFVDPEDEDEDEDIYGAIQGVVDDEGEDVYAEMLGKDLSLKQQPKESGDPDIYSVTPDEKRNCVLNEIVDTEKNYVKLLETIIQHFMVPLEKQGKIITRVDHKAIFSNITEVLAAHKEFQKNLERQMSSQTGRLISQCIINAMKPFRCYGLFCCEIPEAMGKIKELASKPVSARVLDAARVASGQRFPLKDLLNVPMQRILKYPLLVKELLKHTPESHPDKPKMREAFVAVQELAKFINDTKMEFDTLKATLAQIKGYVGKPLGDYGAQSKDGDLMYKTDLSKDRLKLRYVFLFAGAIILCKPKGVFYQYKSTIEFEPDQEIIEVNSWTLPKEEQTGKYIYFWSLKTKKGETHIFAAHSMQFKKKWQAAMQLNIDFVRDRKIGGPETAPRSQGADTPGRGPLPAVSSSSSFGSKAPASRAASSTSIPSTPTTPATPTSAGAKKPLQAKQSYEQWEPLRSPTGPSASAAAADADSKPSAGQTSISDETSWFAGKMPRQKAEKLMMTVPDGTFMVRESDATAGSYSFSVKYGHVKHIKINYADGKYDIAPDSKPFPTILELVEHFQVHSLSRHFPGMETTLAIPFKATAQRASTLKVGTTMGSTAAPLVPGIGRCRSRYAYTAKSADELTFERGLEITILATQLADPGWWKGRLPSGLEGIFPANYVTQL